MSFLYSGSLWSSLYCGFSSLCVGLYRWLVKFSWLWKLVSVFWWVELYFFFLLSKSWVAFLGAWCPLPAFSSCFMEFTQHLNALLMNLWGRKCSPHPTPPPSWCLPAISFSRESSQPRDWTQVSHIVDRRFTIWTIREALRLVSLYEGETSGRYVHRGKVMRGHSQKVTAVKGRRELSPETSTVDDLILVVQAQELSENKRLSFNPPSLW